MWILLLFIAVPIIEIALFIRIGGLIGLWPTLGIVVLTAILGPAMLRQQGLRTLNGLQDQLRRGSDPSPLLLEGALLLVGGVLLLTPGFFTDAVGFALLVPQLRAQAAAWLRPRIVAQAFTFGTRTMHSGGAGGPDRRRDGMPGGPIDAEYREIETPEPGRRPAPPRD